MILLTHSFPRYPFSTPWKHQKTVRLRIMTENYRSFYINSNEIIKLLLMKKYEKVGILNKNVMISIKILSQSDWRKINQCMKSFWKHQIKNLLKKKYLVRILNKNVMISIKILSQLDWHKINHCMKSFWKDQIKIIGFSGY